MEMLPFNKQYVYHLSKKTREQQLACSAYLGMVANASTSQILALPI